MRFRTKLIAWTIVLLTVTAIGFSTIPTAKAQFVLAEWDFPDEYAQGITFFNIYGNSTGSWVQVGGNWAHDESSIFDWYPNASIKLRCWTIFNYTLTGAVSLADGQNLQKHNVTVTNAGTLIFSQENFTYAVGQDLGDGIYRYGYDVVLNFLPISGLIYTVIVTYEVFY